MDKLEWVVLAFTCVYAALLCIVTNIGKWPWSIKTAAAIVGLGAVSAALGIGTTYLIGVFL